MSTAPGVDNGAPIHPSAAALLRYFAYDHLPFDLKRVSIRFAALAEGLVELGLQGPELTVALRKLLEAKDCAVRAALDGSVASTNHRAVSTVVRETILDTTQVALLNTFMPQIGLEPTKINAFECRVLSGGRVRLHAWVRADHGGEL